MKNKTWIIFFCCMLAVLTAAALLLQKAPAGQIANIYQDGVCIRSIDLSQVDAPYSFLVTDGNGHENLVEVKHGNIRVASANCPDQVCVNRGWMGTGVEPIVCLPAKLVIRLEKTENSDGAGIDAVAG